MLAAHRARRSVRCMVRHRLVLLLAASAAACATPAPPKLWNGLTLRSWHTDVPEADKNPMIAPSFMVRDGHLLSLGNPQGHLISDQSYANYRLTVEWRWPEKAGNCGILVHCSKPRRLYGMFPQSIECQLESGNAGDFWCIGENIAVPDMEARRGPKEKWGGDEGQARRVKNLTDGSEKPLGEWNHMVIECRERTITVWVNGDLVNQGSECTADHGQIAIQAEGTPCEFRRLDLELLQMPEKAEKAEKAAKQ